MKVRSKYSLHDLAQRHADARVNGTPPPNPLSGERPFVVNRDSTKVEEGPDGKLVLIYGPITVSKFMSPGQNAKFNRPEA